MMMMMTLNSITKVIIIIIFWKIFMAAERGGERFRKWIFTAQGEFKQKYVETFFDGLVQDVVYVKVAQEKGEGGRLHLQGYVETSTKVSLKGIMKYLKPLNSPHIEPAFKPEDARDYIGNLDFVHKDGKVKGGEVLWLHEHGAFDTASGESKLKGNAWNESLFKMKAVIDNGGTLYDLYQGYFIQMVHCGKAFKDYLAVLEQRKQEEYIKKRVEEPYSNVEAAKIKQSMREQGHADCSSPTWQPEDIRETWQSEDIKD